MSFEHDLDDTPLDDSPEFVSMHKYTKAQGEIHRKNEDNLRRFQDIEKRQQMYCVTIILVVVVGMAVGIAGIVVSGKGNASLAALKKNVAYCASKPKFLPTTNINDTSEIVNNYANLTIKINEIDQNVAFNIKNGKFTAPIAGVYQISAQFLSDWVKGTSEGSSAVSIRKNGKEIIYAPKKTKSGPNSDDTSISILVELARTETVHLHYDIKDFKANNKGISDIFFCVNLLK